MLASLLIERVTYRYMKARFGDATEHALPLVSSLGFLIVAPALLFVLFLAFGRGAAGALVWSLAGAVVVHVVFYKMLRVPLPWGVIPPFY